MRHELPAVKVVTMQPRPKNPWWRGTYRCAMRDVVDGGKYQHRHLFGPWEVKKAWRGREWFLYEDAWCVYDDCGQIRVRHTKVKYCKHCGSMKETKR